MKTPSKLSKEILSSQASRAGRHFAPYYVSCWLASVAAVPHPCYGKVVPRAFVERKNEFFEFFKAKVEQAFGLQGGVEFVNELGKPKWTWKTPRTKLENLNDKN